MKKLLMSCIMACGGMLACESETVDEAYARLSSYRSLWDTNAVAYTKTVWSIRDPAFAVANGKWFVDFLSYPDESAANKLEYVLYAKESVISRNASSYGVQSNTNCWYALADYIARLKAASDPRWIDEKYNFVTEVLDDGVTFGGNTNPLLDFASYKLEHYEEYKRQHTNLVTETAALNSFYAEWSDGVSERQKKERALKRIQDFAKQTMKERFWLFGAKDLSADVKALCRSNIVDRAHLTPEEEHDIFEDVPDWYYRVMGIRRK